MSTQNANIQREAGQPSQSLPKSSGPTLLLPEAGPLHYVVFDIETQKNPKNIPGGWAAARRGEAGMSCAVAYDSKTNWAYLFGPGQEEAGRLAALLRGCIVISYNGIDFDIPALEGMIGKHIEINEHIDILAKIVQTTGSRKGFTLNNVSDFTLGQRKDGFSPFAPEIFQDAMSDHPERWVELLEGCMRDVRLTRDLLLFAQKNAYLLGPNGIVNLTLEKWWSRLI